MGIAMGQAYHFGGPNKMVVPEKSHWVTLRVWNEGNEAIYGSAGDSFYPAFPAFRAERQKKKIISRGKL